MWEEYLLHFGWISHSHPSLLGPSFLPQEGAKKRIKFKVGLAALPHPFKRPDGCSSDLREHGPRAYAEDVELSEDAAFVVTLPWVHEHGDEVTYIGK